jgi:DNA-binding NarL/FixJ family response regulator
MHENEGMILKAMELGASSYLLKDTALEVMEAGIREVVAKGYYYTETLSRILHKGLSGKAQPLPTRMPGQEPLGDRELEVLRLICAEKTTPEIGDILCLSPRTVEKYRLRLLEKTGSRNTAGLVRYAIQNGIAQ